MSILDNYNKEQLQNIILKCNNWSEFMKELGYTARNGSILRFLKKHMDEMSISYSHFKSTANKHRCPENVFVNNSDASQKTLRKYYLAGNYTEYICSICGQPPLWNGKDLSLTLDHINGNNHNNELSNLRWVCPNCDRQLDTFGAKNKIRY